MTLWMARAGKRGQHEAIALDNGVACIGFLEVPDLSRATTKDAVQELVRMAYPDDKDAKIINFTGQLHSFAHRMKKGDLVVLPLKTRPQIAVGRIAGSYEYRSDLGEVLHTRKVDWLKTDIPRIKVGQDLLYSMGAFMTVCKIKRNNAEERIKAILDGKPDPGIISTLDDEGEENIDPQVDTDVDQLARDQILSHIEVQFKGHELSRLVDAVLQAEGYVTHLSPPGPDKGVDILARKGALGFDDAKLCVQVKSSSNPVDVTILRGLQGTMSTFNADQGLLVSWGGFNNAVLKEATLSFFSVRLWNAENLLEAIMRNYDRLPEELQKELPLKRIWALVFEE